MCNEFNIKVIEGFKCHHDPSKSHRVVITTRNVQFVPHFSATQSEHQVRSHRKGISHETDTVKLDQLAGMWR